MRPQAQYGRSLDLLDRARKMSLIPTKSGMMLGAGETKREIAQSIHDLADVGCAILTLGQYLSPSTHHVPVERFVHPRRVCTVAAASPSAWAFATSSPAH